LSHASQADFDDAMATQAKALLRAQNRGLRASYPTRMLAARSDALCGSLLNAPWFLAARAIVFCSAPHGQGGVDLGSLAARARELGKITAYPRVDFEEQSVSFHACDDEGLLESRGLETAEAPATHSPLSPDTVDLILVPVLAVDPTGHFVADGSGTYDHALQSLPSAVRVAVAFDFQLIPEAPRRSGDVPVTWIVTDVRVIQVRAAAGAAIARECTLRTARADKEVCRAIQPDPDAGPDPGGGVGDRLGARMGICS
jgi:5-formyltetrahydrofolate cyclo-ligase